MYDQFEQPTQPPLPVVVAILLLFVRGLLLWLVVPVGVICWLPCWALSSGRVTLGNFLGWLDLNLVAGIERSALRPFVASPLPWTPARDMSRVTHRIRLTDPV